MRAWVTICILTTALAGCRGTVPVPEVEFGGPETLESYLDAYRDVSGGPPSISVAVALDGEVVLARAVGWSDEAKGIAATPDTRYRTYSISKAITAVAVLQLVESGAVALDDPVHRYVPRFPAKKWPITVRQLLSHTSGIRHYKPNAGEISSTTEYGSLAESLVVFADDPLEFQPGTSYGYTSFGFNLLTGVIESASGQSFGDYLADHVFALAGASRSGLDRAGDPPLSGDAVRATAYWPPKFLWSGNAPIAQLPNVSGRYGSSGVLSTPTDLVKLLAALEEDRLLSPETRELMIAAPFPQFAPNQALGWNIDGEGCRQAVYRSGAGTGFTGLLIHYPRLRLGGAVLVNQNQWPGRLPLLGGILDHYVEELASERCGEPN